VTGSEFFYALNYINIPILKRVKSVFY
jgi:hypothetical protein